MRLRCGSEKQIELARCHFEEVVESYDERTARRSSYIDDLDARALDLIRQRGCRSLLDVGCGTGRLMRKVHSAGTGCRSLGLDVSPGMIAQCRSQGFEADVCDFGQFETKARFDLITMQFGVYGYLAAQYPPKDVLEKAINLLTLDGVLLFDDLNPYCVTYGPLGRTLPALAGRIVSSIRHGGIVMRNYLGRSQTPVAMAMITDRKLDRMLRSLGCVHRKVWLPYSVTRATRWLPRVLTAHRVVYVARDERSL